MQLLTDFILDCVADDEQAAARTGGLDRRWRPGDDMYSVRSETAFVVDFCYTPDIVDHLCRHDPQRVLADCAVVRLLVALHTDPHPCNDTETSPCTETLVLALPYADRPGYRQDWG